MKLLTMVCLALFPFLHQTIYKAELVSCEQDAIVLHAQGNDMLVSLFNLKITEEKGWKNTCNMLKKADVITFEIDRSSSIEEPIPVYLFADNKLIQEELIRSKQAYSMIQNPEFKYQKQLTQLEQSDQTIAANAKAGSTQTSDYHSFGFLYLLSFLAGWIYLYFLLFYKKKKKSNTPKTS